MQKFYKSSKVLTNGFNRLQGRLETWDLYKVTESVKDEYKHLFPADGFDVICVSNARTHAEKLAFAAIKLDDGTYGRTQMQIEGFHTMMIYGGDVNACWDDEKYLRLIARHNGYGQHQVVIAKEATHE